MIPIAIAIKYGSLRWNVANNAPIPGPMIKPNDVIAENVPKFLSRLASSDMSPIIPITEVWINAALIPPSILEDKSV